MPNTSLKSRMRAFVPPNLHYAARYVARVFAGLARDYWKDGGQGKGPKSRPGIHPADSHSSLSSSSLSQPAHDPRQMSIGPDGLWHAQAGEISERMWGVDCVMPADGFFTEKLVRLLSLDKDMTLLDLSAGLGHRLRKVTEEFGSYVTGLEPDAALAARGMELSIMAGLGKRAPIAAYDPAQFAVEHAYDAIVFREAVYRVADKAKFIKSVVACCKPKAQLSFTDYVVNPEVRDESAIIAWREMEPGANPVSLVEMAELWVKAGINLRVHDDQTDYYKKEVMMGLARFAKFMASGIKPDALTKKAIDKRITTWAHRMAAINAGMKFYRFYGTR